jgi:Predicted nucleic-acid-binding protein implicated in transcription termination
MKVKKIPQRTCLGCKSVKPKKELIRMVRTPDGEVLVDPTGKKSGRGVYTCASLDCLEASFKGSMLDKALEVHLSPETKERLRTDLLKLIS